MSNIQILGERIRYYRTLKGLTQIELAKKLGVASRYIGNIERGLKRPSLNMQVEICRFFGISMADILPIEETPAPALTPEEIAIGEIVKACRSLEMTQLEFVKATVYFLRGYGLSPNPY